MRIGFIIWSDPSLYINLIFLAEKLNKNGHDVFIFYKETANTRENLNYFKSLKNVKKIAFKNPFLKKFKKISFFLFLIKTFFFTLKYNINMLFGFNFHGILCASVAKLFLKKTKIIDYNFDFNEKDQGLSQKLKTLILRKILKKVVVSVTPSENRSKIYKKKYKLKKQPISMYNTFPRDFFKLENKKLNKKKTIIRLGSFNDHHDIENLILSSKYLDNNYKIILAGVSYNNYFKKMKKIVKKNKLSNVILFKNVNYSKWFKILSLGDLGISFYEQINTSHKNMAGTSQKFNNYLLAGIPILVNRCPDFENFDQNRNVLYFSKNQNPIEISNSIKSIFKNKNEYYRKKNRTKKIFLNELNFEKQYLKIEKYIN